MNPANANVNNVIQSIESHFAAPLDDETRQVIKEVFGDAQPHRFGAAPAGALTLASALPEDFWSKVLANAGPLIKYLLETFLSLIPVASLSVAESTIGAALPAAVWAKIAKLVGVVATSLVRDLLNAIANPGYVAPQPEATS